MSTPLSPTLVSFTIASIPGSNLRTRTPRALDDFRRMHFESVSVRLPSAAARPPLIDACRCACVVKWLQAPCSFESQATPLSPANLATAAAYRPAILAPPSVMPSVLRCSEQYLMTFIAVGGTTYARYPRVLTSFVLFRNFTWMQPFSWTWTWTHERIQARCAAWLTCAARSVRASLCRMFNRTAALERIQASAWTCQCVCC